MSQRHYLEVIDKRSKHALLCFQILGNHDYFDDEFYTNIGVETDSSDCFDVEIKDYAKFILEWYNYLERHPELMGLPKIPKGYKERFNDSEEWKDSVFLHYLTADSIELQLYTVTQGLFEYIECDGIVKEGYKLLFTCY